MLSHKVLTRQDVGRAASYYEDSADDYFVKDGEMSAWWGRGADLLGLEGAVDSDRFKDLLAGKIDDTSWISRANTRQDSKTRLAIDLTFSAPKSVSLQALIGGDADIILAHDKAVRRAIEIAETRAQARQKINGKPFVERTGNLVVAAFRHETSREQDPQLHTHAVVMNLTRRDDGAWRALKNDEIIKATKYLGAVYRAELAHELQQLGYSIRHGRDGLFELAHISRDQIAEFSKRGLQVERHLAKDGLDRATASSRQKQQATLRSRARKKAIDRRTLHGIWTERAKELSITFDHKQTRSHDEKTYPDIPREEAAKRVVRYAINHLTERQSIILERELIDRAVKHGMGQVRLEDIQLEISRLTKAGTLILEAPSPANQDIRYTTQIALEREKRILSIERDGRNRCKPILSEEQTKSLLHHFSLNKGQRDAITMILKTRNRVTGILGLAGTGKSHMLIKAKQLLEQQGVTVRAFAPYGTQVKELQRLNIPAKTLASFLKSENRQLSENTLVILDEAAITPTRLMEQLLKLTEQSRSRVLLLGDTAQTKAIEAGRPFDQLLAHGMQTAYMTDIQRQKNPELKRAVELAASGQTDKSLDRIKDIVEVKDKQERLEALAKAYLQLSAEEQDKTLIVSGTNEARRDLNALIRQGLGLSGTGILCTTLIRRDTTQAERRYAKNYHIGDIIQPEKDYARSGLKRGKVYTILETGPENRLVVVGPDENRITFSPSSHRKLAVYQHSRTELSPGDKVRITRNDKLLGLANGDRFEIVAIDGDAIHLGNGERNISLPSDSPLHLDYAYATTIHSAQGLTAERVLIEADTKSFTTSKEIYYVAISRAREEARIYTDDRSSLPETIAREQIKTAALDLEQDKYTKQQDFMRDHEPM